MHFQNALIFFAIFISSSIVQASGAVSLGRCTDVFGKSENVHEGRGLYSEALPIDSNYTVLAATPDQFEGYIFRSIRKNDGNADSFQGDPAEQLAVRYPQFMRLLGYETSGETPYPKMTFHPDWRSLRNRVQILKILGFDIGYLPAPIKKENYNLSDETFTRLRAKGLFPYVSLWFHEARDHVSVSLPFGRFFRIETRKLALIESLQMSNVRFEAAGRQLTADEFYPFGSGTFELFSGHAIYNILLDSHSSSARSTESRQKLLGGLLNLGKSLVSKLGGDYSIMPIRSEHELAVALLKKAEADGADARTLGILEQAVKWSSEETLSKKEGADEIDRILMSMEDPSTVVPNLSVELMTALFRKMKDLDNLSTVMEKSALQSKNLTLMMKARLPDENIGAFRSKIETEDNCRVVRIFKGTLIVEGSVESLRNTILRPEVIEVMTGLE